MESNTLVNEWIYRMLSYFPQVDFYMINPDFWIVRRLSTTPCGYLNCHPKVPRLKPIHALPASLLGFHSSSLLPLPTSDFQMSSEPSCFRMPLPNPLWRFVWGWMNFVSWLWPAFCSCFTSHSLHPHPCPIPRLPHNLQDHVLQTPTLKFSSFSLHSKFPSKLISFPEELPELWVE